MSTANPYGPPTGPGGGPPGAPPSAGPTPGPTLDFGRAITFFFQDPNWVSKIVMGSLFTILAMIVVGGPFLAGYAVRLLRRSAKGEAYPLPEWDDLGGMFMEGLYVVAAYMAHVLPAFVLMFIFMVPLAAFSDSRGEPSGAVALLVFPLVILVSLAVLAIMIYFPAALTRFAVEERFGAAFEIDKNWAFIRRNFSNYLLALVVFIVANFISQFGIILFCIGILPATFWGTCAGAYALGEVVYRDPERTVSPAPPPPPAPSVAVG